ncbi:MAG: efflux RND transporter periplasmic adaptor subunit [Candidatus Omnitrophica bacterium]|nr:efflux RND transporter periplasmic adaptor subunit [Candidatus Omnitrophota bacterium]
MRLVKKEPEPSTQTTPNNPNLATPESIAKQFTSICYLHNCEKLHEGKPCPMTVVAKPGEKVTCPVCGTHVAGGKILYWTDPMIPGFKAEGPGKSPMGMDLVPVYEEIGALSSTQGPDGYAPILLTPQKQQLIGVRTAPVERKNLTKTIRTVGQIAYDPQLYQAQQEYLQALQAAKRAEQGTIPEIKEQSQRLLASSRLRLRLLGMNDALIDEMASWQAPDQSLLLADPEKRVWLYATIYEYELPLVAVGQTIQIDIPSVAGVSKEGVIRSIDPIIDPQSRSVRVRAVLTDPEGILRPGMYVNASIQVQAGETLAIPEEAVFHTGTKSIVFIDKGQGLFEPRDVQLGMKADGFYEVKVGLSNGEAVVTSGNFLIDSESRLKAALEGMGGGSSEGHQHGQ